MTAATLGTGTRTRRHTGWKTVVAAGALVLVAVQLIFHGIKGFPTNWNINLGDPFDHLYDWVLKNQQSHWLFTRFFTPVSHSIKWLIEGLESQLLHLPWYGLGLIAFAIIARTGNWRMALVAAGAALAPGFVGVWEPTMQTMALMLVSVGLAVAIGVPLGVAAGLNRRVERFLRPVLDAMQTVPTPAFLVPAVIFFTFGQVPAAVATIIYALPPVVRLTALGIKEVPPATVEAGTVFGSSKRQTLFKIQLPQAVPSIATGVNQTINMALGIIIIAAFVGAGGLGQAALETLRQRRTGRGLVVGFAVVAVAILLDRVSRSFIERKERSADEDGAARKRLLLLAGACVALIVVGKLATWTTFPHDFGVKWADFFDDWVRWFRDQFHTQTKWLNDTFVREVYVRGKDWVRLTIVWPVWVLFAAMLGFVINGWKLATFCAGAVAVIGLTGLWIPASETFVQVMLTVIIATAIAVPVGIWAGRRSRIEPVLSPILDAFQTVPAVIYIIPFVMIFEIGVVPGIIASVIYALPPGIRVTSLGIKQVPESTIEAGTTFGASKRQLLWGVRVPLALSAIMVAINQVILMVVAMVIIVGLNGGGGLGYKLVESFQRQLIGQGVEVALVLTLMAMVLDRLTQALALRAQPPAAN